MKTLFKLIKWGLVLVVALAVVLFLGRNTIARMAVEIGTKQKTGFPLSIGSVDIGLFNSTLEVRDLKMTNPPEFQGGTFVDLPLLRVNYDTVSMLRRSPHIKELIINLNEIVIVKNEKGESNTTRLQNSVSGSSADSGGTPKETGEEPRPQNKQPYRVDLVKIHIGTVIIKDYSSGRLKERKMTLNMDATYKNITESTNVTTLVMNTVFKQLGTVVGDVVKGLGDAAKGATDAIQKTGKGIFDIFKKKQ